MTLWVSDNASSPASSFLCPFSCALVTFSAHPTLVTLLYFPHGDHLPMDFKNNSPGSVFFLHKNAPAPSPLPLGHFCLNLKRGKEKINGREGRRGYEFQNWHQKQPPNPHKILIVTSSWWFVQLQTTFPRKKNKEREILFYFLSDLVTQKLLEVDDCCTILWGRAVSSCSYSTAGMNVMLREEAATVIQGANRSYLFLDSCSEICCPSPALIDHL